MLDNGWNLGGYGFWDHRRTTTGNSFNQVTLGLEALGRDLEFRANAYLPFGNASRTLDTVHNATFSGGGLMVTSTYLQETALPGFDVEAGWRVPFHDAEDARQFRLYLAGYRFADDGEKVEGARVRGEYTLPLLPETWDGAELTLNAGYQHDNARDGQGFAGLRLRVPFGRADKSAPAMSAQERRMVAPVVRDIDIVTKEHTTTQAELATATGNGENLVAISSADVAGGTLAGLIAGAGANSTVVLDGDFTNIGQIELLAGQTLMGRGSIDVMTSSGQTVSVSLPGASVSGTLAGNNGLVAMADNSSLIGMTITHLDPSNPVHNPLGVVAENVSNAVIRDNTIYTTSSGGSAFGVRLMNSTNITVANNYVFAHHSTANAVALQFASASGTAYGNTILADGATNSYAVFLVDLGSRAPEILSGSVENINLGGSCYVSGPSVGQIYFVDGSHCP